MIKIPLKGFAYSDTRSSEVIDTIEDHNCEICGLSLKGFKGGSLSMSRPVDPAKPEGPHRIYRAFHTECVEDPSELFPAQKLSS